MALTRHRFTSLVGLALLGVLVLGVANAQSGGEPGRFDYYVLVLGWTPSYCATEGRQRHNRECNSERSYAFTLHGLCRKITKEGRRIARCRGVLGSRNR
jgi:ribonuclease T2